MNNFRMRFIVFATYITLSTARISLYYGRIANGNIATLEVQPVEGVVALALAESPGINHYFDCNSTIGINFLVWSVEGSTIRLLFRRVSNALRINITEPSPIDPSYQAIFKCRNTLLRDEMSIRVSGGSAVILAEQPAYEVIQGSNVSLRVYASARPPILSSNIQWFRPDSVQILFNSTNYTIQDVNKELIIMDAHINESGSYQIFFKRRIGDVFLTRNTTTNLIIVALPVVIADPAANTAMDQFTTPILTCTIHGHPKPTITWEREGSSRLGLTESRVFHTTVENSVLLSVRSELRFPLVAVRSEGRYRCSASNSPLGSPVKSAYGNLTITLKLSISLIVDGFQLELTNNFMYGVPVSAKVEAYCFGAEFLIWKDFLGQRVILVRSSSRDSGTDVFQVLSLSTTRLIFNVFTREFRSVYTCVTNETRESVLISSFIVDMFVMNDIVYASRGQNASFSGFFVSQAISPSSNMWQLNGTLIDTTSRTRYLSTHSEAEGLFSLTIMDVDFDVMGVYDVTVMAGVFSRGHQFNLIQADPPTASISPLTISVNEGDAASFMCQAGGTEVSVLWTLEGNRTLPPGTEQRGNNLMVHSASRNNNGVYFCTVTNIYYIFSGSSAAILFVMYPSTQVSAAIVYNESTELSYLIAEERDATISLVCVVDGFPKPSLVWSWPSQQSSTPRGLSVMKTASGDQVTLQWERKLSFIDSGNYTCQTFHPANLNSVTVRLFIRRPPTIASIYSTSPVSSITTSSFLVPLGFSGTILTCSGFGWPPPSIEWARNGASRTGRKASTGNNPAYVYALLVVEEGETFVGKYECIVTAEDGTNQKEVREVLVSTVSNITVSSTGPPNCTVSSPAQSFQIRVLEAECSDWMNLDIAMHFQYVLHSVIAAQCSSCNARSEDVLIMDVLCSSIVRGAAVFKGVISTEEQETTQGAFCALDSWSRTGPNVQINEVLYSVDRNCDLLDTVIFSECDSGTNTLLPNLPRSFGLLTIIGVGVLFIIITMVASVIVFTVMITKKRSKRRISEIAKQSTSPACPGGSLANDSTYNNMHQAAIDSQENAIGTSLSAKETILSVSEDEFSPAFDKVMSFYDIQSDSRISRISSSIRKETSSTRNDISSIRKETSSTRNDIFSSIRKETSSTRNDISSIRKETSSTRNESSSIRKETSARDETFSIKRDTSSNKSKSSGSKKKKIFIRWKITKKSKKPLKLSPKLTKKMFTGSRASLSAKREKIIQPDVVSLKMVQSCPRVGSFRDTLLSFDIEEITSDASSIKIIESIPTKRIRDKDMESTPDDVIPSIKVIRSIPRKRPKELPPVSPKRKTALIAEADRVDSFYKFS